MTRLKSLAVILLLTTTHSAIGEETSVAKKYAALVAQYEEEGGTRAFAKRFLALANEDIASPAAADALLWVVDKVRGRRETVQALSLLERHHAGSDKLGPGLKHVAQSRAVGAEQLLRVTLKQNKSHQVRALACYYLAELLDREATIVEQLRAHPGIAPRVLQYYGKEYGDHLGSLVPVDLAKQREQVYEQLLGSFADLEIQGEPIGAAAKKKLTAIRTLSVGKIAPEIKGLDISGTEFKLSDYRGKVIMLSFWGHW